MSANNKGIIGQLTADNQRKKFEDLLIKYFKEEKELTKTEVRFINEYLLPQLETKSLSPQAKLLLVHYNQDDRLSIIARVQKNTLDHLFKTKPDEFFKTTHHYDWWAFPMHVPAEWNWQQRNYDASLTLEEAQTLLYDEQFTDTYRQCITCYLDALEKHGWNNYPVRYARMLCSLSLFLEASRSMEDNTATYPELYQLGKRAIKFGKQDIFPRTPNYELMIQGITGTELELGHYEENQRNQSLSSFNPMK